MWCFHDRLREFTFSDGSLIQMCPDCTQFDTKRKEALRVGRVEMPKAKEELHWALLTEKAGVDVVNDGLDWFTTFAGNTSGALKMAAESGLLFVTDVCGMLKNTLYIQRKPKSKPTTLDDYEHDQRQAYFPHTQAMPRRFTAYCPQCTDVVVDGKHNKVRTTKGAYLPIEHECASVRIYDLRSNLIEVIAI